MVKQKWFAVFVLVALLLNAALVPAMAQEAAPGSVDPSLVAPESLSSSDVVTASDGLSLQQPIDPEQLIERLNVRFSNEGIHFFPLESTDGVLRSTDAAKINDVAIDPLNVLHVSNEAELAKAVSDFYETTRRAEAASIFPVLKEKAIIGVGPERSVEPTSLINYYRVASWYEPACGPNAWFMGGVFCWKNIGYTYQIDDIARRVRNPAVASSWITGLNIMSWNHTYGSAYMINTKTAQLQAWGYYVLGVQINGFTIGATWNGYWSRTVNPPCAICG